MTPVLALALLALGLAAGVASGLFGIGGGVIIVLALTSWFGLDQKTATGTSLAALVAPVGLLACLEYQKRGQLKPYWAVAIAMGLFFGSLVGAKLTAPMSQVTLRRAFGVFLVVLGLKNLWKP